MKCPAPSSGIMQKSSTELCRYVKMEFQELSKMESFMNDFPLHNARNV